MGKLVRVLVVLFLVLSVVALALGVKLFGKREMLKGRAQKLEASVVQLGTVIEKEPATAPRKADFPARDVSPNTVDFIEKPEFSTFWDTYSNVLELADQPTLNLKEKQLQLMMYYKTDANGRTEKDPMGNAVTSGAGTMQEILDDVFAKAEAQYNRLNETRSVLASVRTELVSTIADVNTAKKDLRTTLKKVSELEGDVQKANGEITELKKKNDEIAEEKKGLDEQVAEQKRQGELLKEKNVELEDQVKQLKKALTTQTPTVAAAAAGIEGAPASANLGPGPKGSVIAVNAAWNFVVLELTEDCMKELLGPELNGQLPVATLMVKRAVDGKGDQFVAKVRVVQVRRDKRLAIADVLPEWKQMDLKEGDALFF